MCNNHQNKFIKILKTLRFISLFIVFFGFFSCKTEAEKSNERNALIDSTITNFQKIYFQNQLDSVFTENKFNGSISVVQNGTKIYEKEGGFKNFKSKSKLDSNAVFAIGSISKQFTAALVLLQEEQGKLKTNEKSSKFLKEFQNTEYQNITINQLLNHTSGLNDFGEKLLFKSGTNFNYSNKGYLFLGKIIEKVSGKSYEENAKKLFEKAGMKNTFTVQFFKNNQNFAGANLGTFQQNQAVENMPNRLSENDISVAAGGILATVNDLHHWNKALFGGKILKPESLQKMLNKSTKRPHYILGDVGYGFGIMMNLQAPKSYFHTGYVKGSPSLSIYYPETQTSVVILSNIADESKGKEGFFRTHAEVKKITDAIENAVSQVQKEMLKKVD